ncbi:MAG: hypothetical protein POG24_05415 [Acidocella sp.]|nr:hypothetical protein [Acidocella sp.]
MPTLRPRLNLNRGDLLEFFGFIAFMSFVVWSLLSGWLGAAALGLSMLVNSLPPYPVH